MVFCHQGGGGLNARRLYVFCSGHEEVAFKGVEGNWLCSIGGISTNLAGEVTSNNRVTHPKEDQNQKFYWSKLVQTDLEDYLMYRSCGQYERSIQEMTEATLKRHRDRLEADTKGFMDMLAAGR